MFTNNVFRQYRRRPILATALIVTIAVFSGISSAQFGLIKRFLAPKVPVGLGELQYVQLNAKDYRAERRLPLAVAREIVRASCVEFGAVFRTATVLLRRDDWAESMDAVYSEAGLFETFRVKPYLGSIPTPTYLRDSGDKQVVYITYRLWRRLSGDQNIVGTSIIVAETPNVIHGVLPDGIEVPNGADVIIVSLDIGDNSAEPLIPTDVVVRGRTDLALNDLEQQLSAAVINSQVRITNREAVKGVELISLPLHLLGPPAKRMLIGLSIVATCFALALLCSALVLVLLKAKENEQALAVRVVLGASPRQLLMATVIESASWVILALPIGVFVSFAYGEVLQLAFSQAQKQVFWLRYDLDVISFLVFEFIAFATILICQASVVFAIDLKALKVSTRSVAKSGWSKATIILISAQVSVCFILVAATVLLRFSASARSMVGRAFNEEIFTCRIALPATTTRDLSEQNVMLASMAESLKNFHGVKGVTFGRRVAYSALRTTEMHYTEVRTGDTVRASVGLDVVHSGYFAELGLQVIDGREFRSSDNSHSRPVALVNQSFARRYSPDRSPIGTFINLPGGREIIGVVPDLDTGGFGGAEGAKEAVYLHLAQMPRQSYMSILVRLDGIAPQMVELHLREILSNASHRLVPYAIKTVDRSIDEQFATISVIERTSFVYAFIVVCITGLALIAVISFQVRRATPDMALRMALGATDYAAFSPTCRWLWISSLIGLALGIFGLIVLRYYSESFGIGRVSYLGLCLAVAVGCTVAVGVVLLGSIPGFLRVRLIPVGKVLMNG